MNKQTCEMLKKIVMSRHKSVLLKDLADDLSVSSRTVLNYWKETEEYLVQESLESAVSFDGKRFECSGKSEDRQRVAEAISQMNFYDYRLNSEERIWTISAHLCAADAPLKIEQFQNLLCTGRTTIINDIKTVRIILAKRGIRFCENRHIGIQMNCGEYQRRELILETAQVLGVMESFHALEFAFSPLPAFFCKLFSVDQYEHGAKHAVGQCEIREGFHFSDTQYYSLVFLVCLCVGAIVQEKRIQAQSPAPDAVNRLASAILKDLPLPYDQNEAAYLAQKITAFGIIGQESTSQKSASYIEFLTDSLLYALSSNYEVDFLSDEVLREYLTAHIRSCISRIRNGAAPENALLQDVLQQYPSDLRILKDHIYILEHGLNLSLNDDETAYILMHILTSIERKNLDECKPKLVVTCNAGIGSGNLLSALIRKNFHVQIAAVCAIHQVDETVRSTQADLVVSTIPVSATSAPVIIMNAIPSEENFTELRRKLAEIRDAKLQSSPTRQDRSASAVISEAVEPVPLLGLIDRDRIALDVEVSGWEEAILAAGEFLLRKGNISVNYLHTMVSLVHRYGPYIVLSKGIALAHAAPEDGMLTPGISLVRLRTPVSFGHESNDPVSVVFACAMGDNPAYTASLLKLMQKIRLPEFLQEILDADDADGILEVIGQ
ncbi:BglG family transcription antiterminator [Caproiciproducens sp.]